MKSKKTIEVAKIVKHANLLLSNEIAPDEFKAGITAMVEHVLHQTGNYQGYSYLTFNETEYNNVIEESNGKGSYLYLPENQLRVYGKQGTYGRKYHYEKR